MMLGYIFCKSFYTVLDCNVVLKKSEDLVLTVNPDVPCSSLYLQQRPS